LGNQAKCLVDTTRKGHFLKKIQFCDFAKVAIGVCVFKNFSHVATKVAINHKNI